MGIWHSIKEIISFIVIIFVIIILALNIGAMLFGIYYIVPFIHGIYFTVPIYVLTPFPYLITLIQGFPVYLWYLCLAIIITVSLILMIYYGIIPYFTKFFKKPFSYKHNGFQDMAELLSFTMFFTMIIYLTVVLIGGKPKSIGIEKYPLYFQMLQLLHASVYEEIMARFLFLGIPVYIVHVARGEKISPVRVLGGKFQIKIPELTFLIISSAVFGLAHMEAWGWWKVIPAFIAGLAMGFLYLRYGIYASILFHFTNDFMSIPMAMDKGIMIIIGLMVLFIFIAGIVFFVSYTIRVSQYFGLIKKPTRTPSPPSPPWVPPPPWISIKCPNCGGEVFEYLGDGKLKCVNCGTIIDSSYSEQSHQSENEYHR